MYTLQDTWIWAYDKSRYKGWNGRFLCIETDKETSFLTNTLPGTLAAYGFTIVLNGSFTALYSGREISIERNHLLITMPGFHLRILAVSDDYSGLCLVADESYTLEAPSTRTAVRTALLPVIEIRQPAVSLSQEEGVRLGVLIRNSDFAENTYLSFDKSLSVSRFCSLTEKCSYCPEVLESLKNND